MAKKPIDPAFKTKDAMFPQDLSPDLKAAGVCDWCAEDAKGRKFYGATKLEAEKSRETYNRSK